MFQAINVKRTLPVRIEQCDLEDYLTDKGWQKTINGWALNSGHEMMQCLGLQMMVEQLSFVEKRDSFLVFEDIDKIRKSRMSQAWTEAFAQYGATAFELFCTEKGDSFIDNFAIWNGANFYLKEQAV